jgi:hypothetical protein
MILTKRLRSVDHDKHQVAILAFAQDKPHGHQVEIAQSDRHDLAVNHDSTRREP